MIAYFKVLIRHLSGGTDEYHKIPSVMKAGFLTHTDGHQLTNIMYPLKCVFKLKVRKMNLFFQRIYEYN